MFALAGLLIPATMVFSQEVVEGGDTTPVQQVITLLSDMRDELMEESRAEAKTYDKFACYCKDTTLAKSKSITTGQDTIESLSASLEEDTSEKGLKTTELKETKQKLTANTAQLQAETVQYEKDKEAYEEKEADLSKAVSSLQSAIQSMKDSKPEDASFLALRQVAAKNPRIADALAMVELPRGRSVSALLQVDPADPEYKYHSDGIVEQLEQLLDEFSGDLADVKAEWKQTHTAFRATKAALEKKIEENKATIESCEARISELETAIAKARKDLVESEALMKDDKLYLGDLTKLCEVRAKEYDQRSSLRAGEKKALSKALNVLTNKVETLDENVNKRALLLQHSPKTAQVSFLQAFTRQARSRSSPAPSGSRSSMSQQDKVKTALGLVQKEGLRLSSPVLASLAMKVSADPFGKVKKMLQQLVERLLSESTEEATKKGFCDTELGKATKDRDFRLADVKKLISELDELKAKKNELLGEADSLIKSRKTAFNALSEGKDLRKEEKADNLDTLKKAKKGLKAVEKALQILRGFYTEAAKAKVLLQASPIDEDTSGAGFEGAYTGKQAQAKGVIGLLEVVKSDFERTIRKTESSEKEAAEEFVKFDRSSKVDIEGKATKKTLNVEYAMEVKGNILEKKADLKTNMKLLDSALKEIESLKPQCIDMTMPYAERVEKRDQEIAALKKALCILDTESVEEECLAAA